MSVNQSIYQDLVSLLEAKKSQIVEEIHNYPPPIPACDAQFNYLLEQRDWLRVELNRLNQLNQLNDSDKSTQELSNFVKDSHFIHEDVEHDIRSQLDTLQK